MQLFKLNNMIVHHMRMRQRVRVMLGLGLVCYTFDIAYIRQDSLTHGTQFESLYRKNRNWLLFLFLSFTKSSGE